MRRVSPLLLLVATIDGSAGAALSASNATTYFALDQSVPELAGDYLREHPGDAIEVIIGNSPSGQNPVEIFYALGPVTHSPAGVCRFTRAQIFPHRVDARIVWDGKASSPTGYVEPPYPMAMVAAMPCPRQDEQAYVALEKDISDPELVQIFAFWKDITTSEQKFDAATICRRSLHHAFPTDSHPSDPPFWARHTLCGCSEYSGAAATVTTSASRKICRTPAATVWPFRDRARGSRSSISISISRDKHMQISLCPSCPPSARLL